MYSIKVVLGEYSSVQLCAVQVGTLDSSERLPFRVLVTLETAIETDHLPERYLLFGCHAV